MISRRFLFRIDGAQENDAFLEGTRSAGSVVYAGVSLTLMRGWIPDFVEVAVADDATCTVTLIELEATENAAVVGARKYLPEPSEAIRSALFNYLERVLARCRSSADPRVADFQSLRDPLGGSRPIVFQTAAALRQPPRIVETLPLHDQGVNRQPVAISPPAVQVDIDHLNGEVSFSPRLHKSVSRTILILDAVVRGWDKSDASLRAWRNLRSQPLRRQIEDRSADFPALTSLLLGSKTGVRLTINDAAHELSEIWNQFQPGRHSDISVLSAIRTFLPIDRTLDPSAPVREALSRARAVLREHAA